MQKHTTFSVAFSTNGVTLKGEFSPQPGLTAVVGPNGVGKTFRTIELTRYLLYGKKALRGAASDYVNLSAVGTFVIRGAEYKIERTPKTERLTDAIGTILAVGADAVTKKVTELMGYGLKVFDLTNASPQHEATALGKMQPSERKRLIDEVVGLASNEAVEKACRVEARSLKSEAEFITKQLRAPDEPIIPFAYEPVSAIEPRLAEMRERQRAADKITATMGSYPEPHKPAGKRPDAEEIARLEDEALLFRQVQAERSRLNNELQKAFRQPSYTPEQIQAAENRLVIKQIMADAVTCPKCGNEFVPGHEDAHMPDGPDLSKSQIEQERRSLADVERYNAAQSALSELPEAKDVSVALDSLKRVDTLWRAYTAQFEAYERQVKANEAGMTALRELGEVPGQATIDTLAELLFECRMYEERLARYDEDKALFERLSASIIEKERLSVEFKRGADELAGARADLKSVLAPVLSQVASRLLEDMTHGKLGNIYVDDGMDIMVNGQRIETLSGGGETVANLALRLALGQILVSQTFPVFFGDEMDADADEERRGAVAAALRALVDKGHLKQVILVTHRSVEVADHIIDLGNTG